MQSWLIANHQHHLYSEDVPGPHMGLLSFHRIKMKAISIPNHSLESCSCGKKMEKKKEKEKVLQSGGRGEVEGADE